MALVILAVITMSFEVKAGTQSLVDYLNEGHDINGMTLELTNAEKNALTKYINQYVDDATADAILSDVVAVEKLIKDTEAKKVDEISKDDFEAMYQDIGEIVVTGKNVLKGYVNGVGDKENKFDFSKWHENIFVASE